ncbi:MAG: hypothetical protein ACJAYX_001957 [Planctomycetota bacterium]|jgi:hypothetical protein
MTANSYQTSVQLAARPDHATSLVLVFGGHRSRILQLTLLLSMHGKPQVHKLTAHQQGERSIYIAELDDLQFAMGCELQITVEYRGDPPALAGAYYDLDVFEHAAKLEPAHGFLPIEVESAVTNHHRDALLLSFFDSAFLKTGEPFVPPTTPNLFDRRRKLIKDRFATTAGNVEPSLKTRHDYYFLDLDIKTNALMIKDLILKRSIEYSFEALHNRNIFRARFASEGLSADYLPQNTEWVGTFEKALVNVRPLLLDILRSDLLIRTELRATSEHEITGHPIALRAPEDLNETHLINAIRVAFEQFAIGALHVVSYEIKVPERDAELVTHGAPNGSAYMLFAEAASYFAQQSAADANHEVVPEKLLQLQHETAFWNAMLEIFTDTAEIVAWLFWSGGARTTGDYAWHHYHRQRISNTIWQQRKHVDQCIPGRRWNIEERFSDLTLMALRDHAYAAKTQVDPTIAPSMLRAFQSRSERKPGTGAYKPTSPERLEYDPPHKNHMTTTYYIKDPIGLIDELGKPLNENLQSAHADARQIAAAFIKAAAKHQEIHSSTEEEHLKDVILPELTIEMVKTDVDLGSALANAEIHTNGILAWDYKNSDWKRPGLISGAWCPLRIKNETNGNVWCYWIGFNVSTT